MTDTPTSGTVSVSRELLSAVHTDLENWLSHDLCECEGGHSCGRTDVEKHRDELRVILAQPAERQEEPAAWANDQQLLLCSRSRLDIGHSNPLYHNLPRQIAGSALQTEYCNTPLYRRPAAQAVKLPDVDLLAQIIRRVDGNHSLGAGALAEKILEVLNAPQ